MNKIGLIVEDDSDVDVLNELIKKIAPGKPYALRRFKGDGCGKLQRKCLQWADALKTSGCTTLIMLHDLDQRNLKELQIQLKQALTPCPIKNNIIVIPVREIEAWLLSDHHAIRGAMKLKRELKSISNPESILDPKKRLGEIIHLKSDKTKYYINTVHNKKIAAELTINHLRRCASFVPLEAFITDNLK